MKFFANPIYFLAERYTQITEESVLSALNPFYKAGGGGTDDIFSFLMGVIRIILSFGGIIAIGFIILGGYQYIISGGSPEATKKATATLTWAIVGAILAFSAALIVDFVIRQVGIDVPAGT